MRKVHGSDAVLAVEERAISGRRCSKEASARFLLMLNAFEEGRALNWYESN